MKSHIYDTLMRFNEAMSTYHCQKCTRADAEPTFNPPGAIRNKEPDLTPVVIVMSYPKDHDVAQRKIYQTPDSNRFRQWLHEANFSDFYMTNAVKCPKQGNIDPLRSEIVTCSSLYLLREINLIKPYVIVAMGEKATQALYPGRPTKMVQDMMMKTHTLTLSSVPHEISVRTIYHPAFIERGGQDQEVACIQSLKQAFMENKECQQK